MHSKEAFFSSSPSLDCFSDSQMYNSTRPAVKVDKYVWCYVVRLTIRYNTITQTSKAVNKLRLIPSDNQLTWLIGKLFTKL